MNRKITIEITEGVGTGRKYEYSEANRIFIGRRNDCDIVIPEKTVSGYHCILNINPPTVRLQDFGSMNGTFINGNNIGQRDRDKSWGEASNETIKEYDLHDGDRIRLGRHCELKCSIEQPIIPDMKSPDENPVPAKEDKDKAEKLDEILAKILKDTHEKNGTSPLEGYDKVALLGKSIMGEVWKVREIETGKFYALKTMFPNVGANIRANKMFLREAALCEQMNHPNVVRTYQSGCANGVFYILMDLCEGGSVLELINKSQEKLSLNIATYIILQALAGLDYVHNLDVNIEIRKGDLYSAGIKHIEAHGIVHRDFNPGNIFLSDEGDHPAAMVANFSMATAFEASGLTDMSTSGLTSLGIAFVPRQQALNYLYAKPEVDVWAAAASYYYMLTGCLPKNLKPQPLLWQSCILESAVPIRQRDPSIPVEIASVIDHALIDRPEIGYKSAAEFRRDIIAALPPETRAYCKGIL